MSEIVKIVKKSILIFEVSLKWKIRYFCKWNVYFCFGNATFKVIE